MSRTLVVVTIMMFTAILANLADHAENVRSNRAFSLFPDRIGDWEGERSRFDERVYDILGVDDSLLSTFRKPRGVPVELYVGFYRSQRKGDLIHSPRNCMPGSGWEITGSSLVEVPVKGGPDGTATVVRLLVRNGSERLMVLYWFHSRGRIITSEYMQKIYLVVDSLVKQRTDGAFVRLISPITGEDDAVTFKRLKDFTAELMPLLDEFIPS